MWLPSALGALIVTMSVRPSVASTGTTAVAPAGIGAPVMMRCTVLGSSVGMSMRPAGMSSATGIFIGCSAVAEATSSARTA